MKKSFKSLLGYLLTVCMLLSCFSAVAIAENAPEESIRTVFEDAQGAEVYSAADGQVRAVTYYTSNLEKDVTVAIAVYSRNSLKGIDYVSDSLRTGTNVLRTNLVAKESGDSVKAFLWEEGGKPVETAVIYGEVNAMSITSAKVTVNGGTYAADINPASKEINVTIPLKWNTSDATFAAYEDYFETATVAIEGEYASISPDANGTYDISEPVEFVVTDSEGNEAVYTLKAAVAEYTRSYNVEGAGLDAGTSNWNTAYRIGAPAYISSDRGDGVWLFSSGSIGSYDSESKVFTPNNINTLSIKTDEETSNTYINIAKGELEGKTNGFALWSTGNAQYNEAFSAEFKIRINSLGGANTQSSFMSVWSSNTDDILFTGKDASEGKYRLAHRRTSTSDIESVPGLELDLGKWYTIKYVYTEKTAPKADEDFYGYEMALYVDGKLVDEFCHGIAASVAADAGSLKYKGSNLSWPNLPQIAFNPYSATLIDMDLDDIKVMRVEKSSDATLASASLTVDGVTYAADINPVRGTISIDVPESVGTEAALRDAELTLNVNDPEATVAVSAGDLANGATVTVTAANRSKKEYKLSVEPSALARNYDAEGVQFDATTGLPLALANEEGVASGWTVSDKAKLPTVTAPVEDGNQYLKIAPNGYNYFGSVISSGNIYSDKIIADVKFRLDSTVGMKNGTSYGSMRSSHGDSLTIDIVDAEKGTYNFGIKNINGDGKGKVPNCPTLEAGKWYDIRYIFRRYSDTVNIETPDWYATEIYIDGKFIAEIQQNAKSTEAATSWHYTNAGRFSTAITNYSQFAIEFFGGFPSTSSVSLDDLYVSYITDWSPNASLITLASDAPVAVLTSSSGTESTYPVTLNPETDEATVSIPYTSIWDEAGAIAGTDWPEIHPEINNAVICLPEGMTATLNGEGEAASQLACDLTKANTLTIGSETYNLVCDFDQRFLKNDDKNISTEASHFKMTTSSVPEGYTCEEMKLSSVVTLKNFANGNTASIRTYDKEILSFSMADGVIALTSGTTAVNYTPENNKSFRLDTVIKNGTSLEIYIEGVLVNTIAGEYTNVLGTSGLYVPCTGSAKVVVEKPILSVRTNQLDSKTVVHLLGDSVSQYYGYDVTGKNTDREGWGRYFCQSFNDSTVVLNHAVSGYNTNIYLNGSSRSGIDTHERWSSIKRRMKEGDYLVIALHWNEENTTDGTHTEEAYKANMNKLIADAKALGVTPVVVTPAVQVTNWNDENTGVNKSKVINLKAKWAEYIREIAQDNEIVCLDLNKEIYENNWLDAYHDNGTNNNEAGWAKAVEIYNTYFCDNTHVTRAGAEFYNNAVVKLISESESGLKDLLK